MENGLRSEEVLHSESSQGEVGSPEREASSSEPLQVENPSPQDDVRAVIEWLAKQPVVVKRGSQLDVRHRYTAERAIEAIRGSYGLKTVIRSRLGCKARTLERLLQIPSVREAYLAERERIVDMAEAEIIRAVQEGDRDAAWKVLKTLGRDRGYGEEPAVQVQSFVIRFRE
jgi:hypothetical protein